MIKPIQFKTWAIYLVTVGKICPITELYGRESLDYFGPGIVTKYKICRENHTQQTP